MPTTPDVTSPRKFAFFWVSPVTGCTIHGWLNGPGYKRAHLTLAGPVPAAALNDALDDVLRTIDEPTWHNTDLGAAVTSTETYPYGRVTAVRIA